MRSVSGLADGLGHGRVRVDRPDQLLDRRLEAQGQGGLGHEFR